MQSKEFLISGMIYNANNFEFLFKLGQNSTNIKRTDNTKI